ncbi:MAG: YqhA family protein [Candidatus Obscuribacter sp.]|nr:YqhA family protein [Candidatus Obscuribacter sp.]
METISISLLLTAVGVLVVTPLLCGAIKEMKRSGQVQPSEDSRAVKQAEKQPGSNQPNQQLEHRTEDAEHPLSFPRLLLMTRWLLAPFYLGLVATVMLYMYKFALKLFALFLELPHLAEKEVMLKVLYLVDIVMVANLLMYTAIGSFAYFVSGFVFASKYEKPAMLGHLDATTLKLKLGMALIGVSSIHLLEAFMDVEQISMVKMIMLVSVHVVFVLSTMAIAWIRTLPSHGGNNHHG